MTRDQGRVPPLSPSIRRATQKTRLMFVCPLPTFKMTKSIVCPAALLPPSEIRCPHKHAMMPVVIRLGKYLSSAITSYLTLKSRRFRSSANEALSEHFYHPRNSAAVRRGAGGSVLGANEMYSGSETPRSFLFRETLFVD